MRLIWGRRKGKRKIGESWDPGFGGGGGGGVELARGRSADGLLGWICGSASLELVWVSVGGYGQQGCGGPPWGQPTLPPRGAAGEEGAGRKLMDRAGSRDLMVWEWGRGAESKLAYREACNHLDAEDQLGDRCSWRRKRHFCKCRIYQERQRNTWNSEMRYETFCLDITNLLVHIVSFLQSKSHDYDPASVEPTERKATGTQGWWWWSVPPCWSPTYCPLVRLNEPNLLFSSSQMTLLFCCPHRWEQPSLWAGWVRAGAGLHGCVHLAQPSLVLTQLPSALTRLRWDTSMACCLELAGRSCPWMHRLVPVWVIFLENRRLVNKNTSIRTPVSCARGINSSSSLQEIPRLVHI